MPLIFYKNVFIVVDMKTTVAMKEATTFILNTLTPNNWAAPNHCLGNEAVWKKDLCYSLMQCEFYASWGVIADIHLIMFTVWLIHGLVTICKIQNASKSGLIPPPF